MIQVSDNYFQLFGIDQAYELELNTLEQKYHELQNQLHPDRFAGGSEADRLRAVQLSSFLNEAYATLRNPLRRAAYLLQLNGRDTETAAQEEMGMELIMEQMALREALEALPRDESALPELAAMKTEVEEKLAANRLGFSTAIGAGDVDLAKRKFHEMQFLAKLLEEIDRGEEARLGY